MTQAAFIKSPFMEPNARTGKKKKSYKPDTLTLCLFTGFAIPVSIVAIAIVPPMGMLLAGYMAYLWSRMAGLQAGAPLEDAVSKLSHRIGREETMHSSGNASFDAYREDLLDRLEKEQQSFEEFLGRLRSAKDKAEFDDFMDTRARMARNSASVEID